jgi:hypothetical protein
MSEFLQKNLMNYFILSLFLLLSQLNLSRYPAEYPVSGLTGYPVGQSGIQLDIGYQKRPVYPAGYPVHP